MRVVGRIRFAIWLIELFPVPNRFFAVGEDGELKIRGLECASTTHVGPYTFNHLTVPNFVPTLDQKPSHLVAMGQAGKSLVLVQKINTIANHRTRWVRRAPQPLTEGLLVRI